MFDPHQKSTRLQNLALHLMLLKWKVIKLTAMSECQILFQGDD